MSRVKSDEAIDTSGMWDRASKVLRGSDSVEGDPILRSQFDTPTTTSSSDKPNGSPISRDDSEKSQWSQLSYKVTQSTQGGCSKEENTSSLPVRQSGGPSTLSPPTDATSQAVQVKDGDKLFASAQDALPVAPALVPSVQRPFSGSPLHFTRASLPPPPPGTNIPSTPAHIPPPALPSEPPANPQPSGYRPPSCQQQPFGIGDTQYQSYPSPLGLRHDSPTPCQVTPRLYTQGFVAPHVQQMYSDPIWLSGQQVAVTPQGKTPVKRISGAFVACDPFRPESNRKLERLSINTTFDDIQIDDRYRFSVSSSGRLGRESLTPKFPQSAHYQTSQPASPYPCQTSPLYQTSQSPGFCHTSQATTSCQATGPYQPPQSTGPSQHASPGQTSQPTDLYQNPLPTPQSTPHRNHFTPAQDHTHQSTSNQFADSVPPRLVNQAQQPNIQEPVRPPSSATNSMPLAHPTPFVEVPSGQTSSPHVGIYNQTLDSSFRNRWSLSATTSSWNGPYYDPPMTGTLPPRFAQAMEYDAPFASSSLSQTHPRPPTVDQAASHQSPQFGLHETMPSYSRDPASMWPEYVLTASDYELYPPEAPHPPFDLFPVVKPSSLWSRIGNVCRRCVVWIRGGDPAGSDGGHYYSTNTFTYATEGYGKVAGSFVLETLPRTLYVYLLLRLPALYFGRVARIFEEADLTLSEIKKMAIETAVHGRLDFQMVDVSMAHPQYERLASAWQTFINDVMREWQTFNIVSVLLLSAILSILSNADVAQDPVSRYFALSALICALISLLFGCMYTVQFGCMRKAYKAAEWALEAKKSQRFIFWNVWVLLALPVVWLSWSILMFFMCIVAFLWRASPVRRSPPPVLSDGGLLAVRLLLTFIIVLAISYGILVLVTFSRYGDTMDKAWKKRVNSWLKERPGPVRVPTPSYNTPGPAPNLAAQQQPCQPQEENRTIAPYDASPASAAPARPQGPTAPRFMLQRVPSDVSDGCGYTKSPLEIHFDYDTQHNTMLNRNSAQYTSGDGENPPASDSAPPTPPSKSSSLRARLATPTSNPTVPRRPLSPIPGTPVTTTTAVNLNSTTSLVDSGPAGNKDEGHEKPGSPHVHFRSPVASARECSPISSNHSSHHHRYPPMPPPDGSSLNIYQAGSDESFDPYKYHPDVGTFEMIHRS